MYTTLITPEALSRHLDAPGWRIIDCRFSLADLEQGRRAYIEAHIPGAHYAHLNDDLSGPPATDIGRHPLPTPQALRKRLGKWGIGPDTQVVAYDDSNGAIAARLWWLLQYMGHEATCVLDGGWTAWLASAGSIERTAPAAVQTVTFEGEPKREWLVVADEVEQVHLLIDSRAPERYRGESEPYDSVAGHIPGAVNYFYQNNWTEDNRHLSPESIRSKLSEVLGGTSPEDAVFYCGSGVTACANILALSHAGLPIARLYAGSWSDWSRLGNPVETSNSGDAPRTD
jgi:thiosulfate/3-mercaptopyruvate sulfurtransferase